MNAESMRVERAENGFVSSINPYSKRGEYAEPIKNVHTSVKDVASHVSKSFGGTSKSSRQPDMGKSNGKRPGLMRGKPKHERMSRSVKSPRSTHMDSGSY